MKILLTGGTGYIGSHTAVELFNEGFDVVIVDNLSNSKIEVIDSIKTITGKEPKFYQGDVRDRELLNKIFDENQIDAVIHFAGLKAVGESCEKPIEYYRNNIDSTLTLVEVMREHNCKNIIFSSSATVYGLQDTPKCVETMKKQTPSNPYGKTKAMIEEILKDLYSADNEWSIFLLRYFNPVGAHESGLLGDNPNGIPNNLMPYVLRVAAGKLPKLTIFGKDYDTPDGTCIRDFIHVVDLAKAHIAALKKMLSVDNGTYIYNLGSNKGVSVQELVDTFERVNNIKLNYEYGERREGDLAELYADATKALNELNWKTEKTIEDMCRDSWNFAKKQFDIE
jgi:UDP-glucose 4-epimerase